MKGRVIIFLGIITGLLVFTNGFSQNRGQESIFVDPAFTLDRWTAEDGLPVNSVNDMIQTNDGYIWLATFDGLVRFDGVRFKIFKSAEYEGLPHNRILGMTSSSDGAIWLRMANDQLVKFSDNTFQTIGPGDGLNGDRAYFFCQPDHTDDLLIGSSNGITIYKNGTLTPYHADTIDEAVSYVYLDSRGIVWYRDNKELKVYRFDGEQKTTLASFTDLAETTPFLTLKNGDTIFSTSGQIYRYRRGVVSAVPFELPDGFLPIEFHQADTRPDEILFSTDSHGFFKISNDSLALLHPEYRGSKRGTFLESRDHLWVMGATQVYHNGTLVFRFNNSITTRLYDHEGSFWFGSESEGLFRLKQNPFTIYSEDKGVPNRNIYPVFEASDGSIWFGTHGDGPVQLEDGAIHTYETALPAIGGRYVRSITETHNGEILIATLGDGLFRLNPHSNTFEQAGGPPRRSSSVREFTIQALFEDSQNRLWAGSSHGLYWKSDRTWNRVPDHKSNPDFTVRYLTEAPDASLWMATNGGGIHHYRNGTFSTYTTEDGLSSNVVRSLLVDTTSPSSGYILWVGTEDKGLNRLPVSATGPQFQHVTAYDRQTGLYDNVVHQILMDDDNRFWMSGNTGIYWVPGEQLNQFARGEIEDIQSTAYTEADGLRNREANGGVQSAGIKSSDGRIWFPTQDGLAVVNPGDITRNEIPPPVVIEQMVSGESVIQPADHGYRLPASRRNFEISYTGLSFMVPGKVRFRYRLTGFDDHWLEAGNRRMAFYTNVPPGDYTFEVIAANNEGLWSSEPAVIPVSIAPYFHETNTFWVLMITALAASILLLLRVRTKNLKKRERVLAQVVAERTAELEQEKQKTEVQAQDLLKLDEAKNRFFTNISHEFRTPLTLIISPLQQLLRKNDGRGTLPEPAQREIERVLNSSHRLHRLVDQILDLSKLEAGALKLSIRKIDLPDFIGSIVDLFKPLSSERDVALSFHPSHEEQFLYADPDALEKILSNLLSNAIKFTPSGGQIVVELQERTRHFDIRVTDTGAGIPQEKLPHIFDRFFQADTSSTRKAEGVGIGLSLTKNLVILHHGDITVKSEPGCGTTFKISLKKGDDHFRLDDATLTNDQEPIPMAQASSLVPELSGTSGGSGTSGTLAPSAGGSANGESREDRPAVLVVEDNADMRAFIASVLSETFTVLQVGDGMAALNLIKEELPDLIISDIMMPNMDGMTLNEELKKDPVLESIPVIFLTAKTDQESKIEGFRKGADDYLTKPFDAEILAARAKNIIKKRQQLRQQILEQALSAPESEEEDPFLRIVMDTLERTFADPDFTIRELAETLHIDRTQLYRRVKESMGETPQQILSDFRMKKATNMLHQKAGSISEVAYATGFNSLGYFSRVFKKYHRVSPSEYLARKAN